MKEINKSKAIIRAFTGQITVTPEVHTKRQEICQQCPFYSGNATLNLVQKVRHHVAAFCTECGCNIVEKTSQATEQCPLSPPKWRRIILETSDINDLNLVNLTPQVAGISIEENNGVSYFMADLGEVGNEDVTFTIGLVCDADDYQLISVTPSCAGCTRAHIVRLKPSPEATITFMPSKIGMAESFLKTVNIKYKLGTVSRNVVLKFRGTKKTK